MEKRELFCAICLTILILDQSDGDWLNCARIAECNCKWSSGKKTASCVRAQLSNIPRLATDIQVLDLNGNPLKELNVDAFASIDLINLQRLNLSSTKLQRIHKYAFRELKILIELDLSYNEFHQLSPDTFKGIDRLRLLLLNNNPLNELHAEQFPLLLHLKTLGISHCQLRRIHPNAFRNLKALETLFAHKNLLSYVHSSTFDLPLLKTLTISENPWYCDCKLRDFYEWFLNANLGNELISCFGPRRLVEVSWRRIRLREMVCPPSVVVNPLTVRVEVGAKITFGCFTNGIPKPSVSWFFNHQEVQNKTYKNSAVSVHVYDVEQSTAYDSDNINRSSQWVNVTITNVTDKYSGEWKCIATSLAGQATAYLNVFLSKAYTATTRVAPEYSIFIVVIGSMLGMTGVGVIATCVCWKARRRLPSSRSLTEQEKKLLDSSLAASCDRQSIDQGSSYDFEMFDRSLSFDSSDSLRCLDTVQITLEHTGIYPPPPLEFALPAPYGNIFISLRLSGKTNEYPDLINGDVNIPRRSSTCILKSVNNDVNHRVRAAGSSTWSLPGIQSANFKIDNNTITSLPKISSEFTAL